MKTIASFSAPIEAHMLISRLEGNGIHAYIRDEHMVTLDWLASNAIGGVKVDVADEDFERAQELIAAGPTDGTPPGGAPKPAEPDNG
jgi:hypothetical protein